MFEWPKWLQTMKLQWSHRMTYKLNFLIMILGPSLVFLFIKYNVWAAVYELNPSQPIAGYSFETMITYQIWVFLVGLLAQGYNNMNMAEDIRLGRISTYLIYPFNFWQFHTAQFLAFQFLQLFVALFSVFVLYQVGLLGSIILIDFLKGLIFSSIVAAFWFVVQYALGLTAFWLEENWVLKVMFLVSSAFLSGGILPLEVFPPFFREALYFTPFPYMTFVPVKIFMGTFDHSFEIACLSLLFWIAVVALLATLLWKKGLKMYTAAGM